MIISFVVMATFIALPPILLAAPSILILIRKLYRAASHRDFDYPAFLNRGPILDQFLNAFHGCYKDGTGGSAGNNIDCRWFAALYFVLRLTLFLVYALTPYWFLQYVIQQLVCLVALLLVVIFRPYKNPFLNIVDTCMFANLAAISALSMYNFYLTAIGGKLYAWSFVLQHIFIFLPLVYMIGYVLYLLLGKYGTKLRRKKIGLETKIAEDESFLEYADQEERYRNISGSYQQRLVNTNRSTPSEDRRAVLVHEEEGSSYRRAEQSLSPSHQSSNYGAFVETDRAAASSASVNSRYRVKDSPTRDSSSKQARQGD